MALICSNRSPTPRSSRPPIAVIAARYASGSTPPTSTPTSVREPCTATKATHRGHHADTQRGGEGNRGETVQNRLEDELIGSATEANSEPRMVCGPTQTISEAVTNPSMNRSRASSSRAAGSAGSPAVTSEVAASVAALLRERVPTGRRRLCLLRIG